MLSSLCLLYVPQSEPLPAKGASRALASSLQVCVRFDIGFTYTVREDSHGGLHELSIELNFMKRFASLVSPGLPGTACLANYCNRSKGHAYLRLPDA